VEEEGKEWWKRKVVVEEEGRWKRKVLEEDLIP